MQSRRRAGNSFDRLFHKGVVDEAFTVAGLNLASTVREPGEEDVSSIAAIELAPFPMVAAWLDRYADRPANRRVAALAQEPA